MYRIFTDMTGRTIEVNFPLQRIVSLVPSQTELLYDLGLADEVVGITKFCVHPQDWFRDKKRVGGTKTINIDIVRSLRPDLILANKEENTKEQIEEMAKSLPVWVSDIQTMGDAMCMIRNVGVMTGMMNNAMALDREIKAGFKSIKKSQVRRRVAYFIWRDPWMCAGGDTFISDMITQMGWENVFAEDNRYPEVSDEELASLDVDLVLLSSEPFPFKEEHIAHIKALLPHTEVMLVDGEMFSWYGSRMKLASPYFNGLISSGLVRG
ncbi:MAG: ABC transporter substrate-binding protein [Taibaiella sp.]|nr:ABC transporter substrate-binding protein [Taibaiella sp.]